MESMPITELHPSYTPALVLRLARMSRTAPNGCIEWTGSLDDGGYGKVKVIDGASGLRRTTGAHRAAWLALAPIEDPTLVLDHLCRNHACMNTDHLELVTNRENVLRGTPGRPRLRSDELHACRTHGREDGYEAIRPDGYARWNCRACQRARMKRWRERSK